MEVREIIEGNDAVMLYFTGGQCGTCSALKPKLEELMTSRYPKVKFLEVDVTHNPGVAAQFTVFTVPAALLFTQGKEANRFIRNFGLMEVQAVLDRVYPLIFS